MQSRVGEDGVERTEALNIHLLGIRDEGVDAARARRLDHLLGAVEADHPGAGLDNPLGQHAVAAADVQDELAGLRVEQLQHCIAEPRHEGRVLRIIGGGPAVRSVDHVAA